jgi:hypothetical protein
VTACEVRPRSLPPSWARSFVELARRRLDGSVRLPVERLVARLLGSDVPRPSVRVWTDVLWATMLELPGAVRTRLRTECGDVTRHLLDTLG